MKNINFKTTILCLLIITSGIVTTANAQTYKTAADTVKLNEEYKKVNADIALLIDQLNEAKKKLPDYQSKSDQQASDAQSAAEASQKQADKASDGDLKNVSKEERKAKKADSEAEDAKDAKNKVADLNKKIKKLNSEIEKKQDRLNELNKQRTAIMGQTPPGQ